MRELDTTRRPGACSTLTPPTFVSDEFNNVFDVFLHCNDLRQMFCQCAKKE